VWPEGLGKFEEIHLIGTRSRDLPACSTVPQPLRYRVPPNYNNKIIIIITTRYVKCLRHCAPLPTLSSVKDYMLERIIILSYCLSVFLFNIISEQADEKNSCLLSYFFLGLDIFIASFFKFLALHAK
jgi:hypothetical protein